MGDNQQNVTNNVGLRDQAALLIMEGRSEAVDIQKALGAVNIDPALKSQLKGVAAQVSSAIREISDELSSSSFTLNQTSIATLQSAVSGEVNALLAQAADESAKSTDIGGASIDIGMTAFNSRVTTDNIYDDIYNKHIYDRNMRYTTTQDEIETKQRMDQNQLYVREQLARPPTKEDPHNTIGTLNAATGMQDSLVTQIAHHAGVNDKIYDQLAQERASIKQSRAAANAQHLSTAEADAREANTARYYLKLKGKSDAEIETILKSAPSAMDAIKPYLDDDRLSNYVEKLMNQEADEAKRASQTSSTAPAPAKKGSAAAKPAATTTTADDDINSLGASLKASGTQVTGINTSSGHGLSAAIQKPANSVDGQALNG